MTEPKLIPPQASNGAAPSQDGAAPTESASVVPRKFKRKIDCCKGSEDDADAAARVGDGYVRPPR